MANRAHCSLGVQNRTPQILSARMAHEWNKFSRFQTERQQSSWSGKRLFDGDVSQSETIRQPTDNRRPFIEWLIFFVGSQDLSDPIPSDPIPYDPIRSVPFGYDPIRSATDPQNQSKSPGPIGIRNNSRVSFSRATEEVENPTVVTRLRSRNDRLAIRQIRSIWTVSASVPNARRILLDSTRLECVRLVMLGTWEKRAQRMRHNFCGDRN